MKIMHCCNQNFGALCIYIYIYMYVCVCVCIDIDIDIERGGGREGRQCLLKIFDECKYYL